MHSFMVQLKPFTARMDLKAVTGIDGVNGAFIFNCKRQSSWKTGNFSSLITMWSLCLSMSVHVCVSVLFSHHCPPFVLSQFFWLLHPPTQ